MRKLMRESRFKQLVSPCALCGKQFTTTKGYQIYCSHACQETMVMIASVLEGFERERIIKQKGVM